MYLNNTIVWKEKPSEILHEQLWTRELQMQHSAEVTTGQRKRRSEEEVRGENRLL